MVKFWQALQNQAPNQQNVILPENAKMIAEAVFPESQPDMPPTFSGLLKKYIKFHILQVYPTYTLKAHLHPDRQPTNSQFHLLHLLPILC